MDLMKAVVFRSPGVVEIEERKKPVARGGQAVIRITTTTICGTDVHIVKGEYPVKPGLILGHEPVGDALIVDVLDAQLAEDLAAVGQRDLLAALGDRRLGVGDRQDDRDRPGPERAPARADAERGRF